MQKGGGESQYVMDPSVVERSELTLCHSGQVVRAQFVFNVGRLLAATVQV